MLKFATATSAAVLLAAVAATPVSAQDATITGVAGGAVAGAVIGGPPGAIIGAIAGGTIGASADKVEDNAEATTAPPPEPYVVKEVPSRVGVYALEQPAPAVTVDGPVIIGQPLPSTVEVIRVPDYPTYAYANVNGHTLIVDSQTGNVIGVVRN
ncbi:hypothetical protein GGD81_001849 [Rhodobium orientis]|uniref:Glycine zipper domain-containing protein n=1 Tax=Rhodobium orientis TaxID=34017 RepID=A0A327JKW9_9HYPH|nr:DUF1236 domain-containing protein [Rhodobium orientis]MBB4302813.1 hypothetical protein [Rhodobium orientis]MBK5948593.1 hypothetical protein [Rhodobium orientis]RAI26286.1 hypothetical protein CH339_14950 [Rhodobium orientis]